MGGCKIAKFMKVFSLKRFRYTGIHSALKLQFNLSSYTPFSPNDLYPLYPHVKRGLAKVRFNQILSGQSDSAYEIHASNLYVGVE